MCIKNAMELSLNGETFAALKEDFDSILAQTLGNMESKGADEAVITLKLGVSLEKQSFVRDEEPAELTKPSFKHDINSVMQVKNKKSGSLSGDYELIWDEDEKKYVMRKITNGQMTFFEDEGEEVEQYQEDYDYEDVPVLLKESNDVETENSGAFDWLSQFVDKSMKITESMGNYTVRTDDGKVVLTSASAKDSVFHCDAEILKKHIGHNIACIRCDEEDFITVECEACNKTLFSMRLYDTEVEDDYTEEFDVLTEETYEELEYEDICEYDGSEE